MKDPNEISSPTFLPVLRRHVGFIEVLRSYEVTETELETLESYALESPDSIYANFSLSLLSLALSALFIILTTPVTGKLYTLFLVILFLGAVLGVFFLVLWRKALHQKKKVIEALMQKIKDRLPPEGEQILAHNTGTKE